jgi:hypothetical protein
MVSAILLYRPLSLTISLSPKSQFCPPILPSPLSIFFSLLYTYQSLLVSPASPPPLPLSPPCRLFCTLPSPPHPADKFLSAGRVWGGEAAASVYSSALIGPMTRSSVIGRPSGGLGPRGTAGEGEGLELPGQYLTGPLLAAIQASRRVDSLPLPPLSPSSDFQELL